MKAGFREMFQIVMTPAGGVGVDLDPEIEDKEHELDDEAYFTGLMDGLLRAHNLLDEIRGEHEDDKAFCDVLEAAFEAINDDLLELFGVEVCDRTID